MRNTGLTAAMSIPKIMHYCFGLAEDFGGKPWSLTHYVCLKSAIEKIKPESVLFYFEHEPHGEWWSLTEPLITKIKITAPREIFGRPLRNPAHRADIVRLLSLAQHGGIYLDADVLVHRNFDPLLNYPAVLGQEGPDAQFGTANAVILAQVGSPFIARWLDQYKWFRGGRDHTEMFWNEHSVQLPFFMSRFFPDEVAILDYLAFYWPLWVEPHIDWIFKSNKPIDTSQSFATHLWESKSWSLIKDLTPGHVKAMDTNFGRWARPYIDHLPDNFGARRFSDDAGEANDRKSIFQQTYAHQRWGHDNQSRFFSGVGSRGAPADIYVTSLLHELAVLRAHKEQPLAIVDLGCGDYAIGQKIMHESPDRYLGCDIVPELIDYNKIKFGSDRISFLVLDAVADDLPQGDVYLVRQVLQHLSNKEIQTLINKLPRHAAIYITEGYPREAVGPINPDQPASHEVRFDWRTGRGRGVELDQPPYNLLLKQICQAEMQTEIIRTYRVL